MLDIDELTGRIKTNLATPELKLDMPILDLGTLPIVEQLDMNNGWRHVVVDCGKLQPIGMSSLSLSFHHGRLKYVSASMAIPGESPLVTHQRHTNYLKNSQTAPALSTPAALATTIHGATSAHIMTHVVILRVLCCAGWTICNKTCTPFESV